MNDKRFRNVPPHQLEAFRAFRATHPEKQLTVGNYKWSYIASGSGEKTLVILVGGSRLAEAAFRLISALERDYRVIVPTYPDATELPVLEEGIAAILDAEHANPVYLMGASFGGMVAQSFVRRYPERVEKLILANTAGIFTPEYVKRLEGGLKKIDWIPLSLMHFAFRRRFARMAPLFPPDERAFWQAFLMTIVDGMTRDSLRSQFACMLDAHRSHFAAADLAAWHGDILVIESDTDTAFPELMRQSMHFLYPQAQFCNLPEAGHIAMITEWQAYFAEIESFLAQDQLEPVI